MPIDQTDIPIIQADQLGAYGNPVAKTPHLVASQRRRPFLRQLAGEDRDYRSADALAPHCMRADKVYTGWAYQGIVGFRGPGEEES